MRVRVRQRVRMRMLICICIYLNLDKSKHVAHNGNATQLVICVVYITMMMANMTYCKHSYLYVVAYVTGSY